MFENTKTKSYYESNFHHSSCVSKLSLIHDSQSPNCHTAKLQTVTVPSCQALSVTQAASCDARWQLCLWPRLPAVTKVWQFWGRIRQFKQNWGYADLSHDWAATPNHNRYTLLSWLSFTNRFTSAKIPIYWLVVQALGFQKCIKCTNLGQCAFG